MLVDYYKMPEASVIIPVLEMWSLKLEKLRTFPKYSREPVYFKIRT